MQRQWPLPPRYSIYQRPPYRPCLNVPTHQVLAGSPHSILWKRWWLEPRLTELQEDFQRLCKTSPWLMTSPPPTGTNQIL